MTHTKAVQKWSKILARSFRLIPDFIDCHEESQLIALARTKLKRLPFLDGHYDGVITGYREAFLSIPTPNNNIMIKDTPKVNHSIKQSIEYNSGMHSDCHISSNSQQSSNHSLNNFNQHHNSMAVTESVGVSPSKATLSWHHIFTDRLPKTLLQHDIHVDFANTQSNNDLNSQPITDTFSHAQSIKRTLMTPIHLLELHPTKGNIGFHLDNEQNSGDFIIGLSCNAPCRMLLKPRLKDNNDNTKMEQVETKDASANESKQSDGQTHYTMAALNESNQSDGQTHHPFFDLNESSNDHHILHHSSDNQVNGLYDSDCKDHRVAFELINEDTIAVRIPARSLYVQWGNLRWQYEHAIEMERNEANEHAISSNNKDLTYSRIVYLLRDEPLGNQVIKQSSMLT